MNRTQDETSDALLAAAHHLLSTVGAEALTVRRIANEAGMSTMNVYSRFGGKDGVIDELFADGYRRLVEKLEAVPVTNDLRHDIVAITNAYREFALANPTYYGIMFRSSIPGFEPSAASVDVAIGLLRSMVERIGLAQANGHIAETFEPYEVAAWMWATCHGLVSLELDGVGNELIDWPTIWQKGIRQAAAVIDPALHTTAS